MKKIANLEIRMSSPSHPRNLRNGMLRFAGALIAMYGVSAHALNAPTADETFSAPSVYVGGVTRMKIALHNSDASDVTGVAISDVYPA